MSRHNTRRPPKARVTAGPHRRAVLGEAPAWTYRLAENESVEALNSALRNVRGKDIKTLRNFFPFTLAYPSLIYKGISESRQANRPTIDNIARMLGRLPLETFQQSVKADVIDVRHFPGTLGVYVTYAGLDKESRVINGSINRALNLGSARKYTSPAPHIVIATGELKDAGQIRHIENTIPEQITLSAIQPNTLLFDV